MRCQVMVLVIDEKLGCQLAEAQLETTHVRSSCPTRKPHAPGYHNARVITTYVPMKRNHKAPARATFRLRSLNSKMCMQATPGPDSHPRGELCPSGWGGPGRCCALSNTAASSRSMVILVHYPVSERFPAAPTAAP